MVAEKGEGIVDGGGGSPCILIVGHMGGGGWGGKVVAFVVEHHGSLGFVLAVASRQDGREAMCVG